MCKHKCEPNRWPCILLLAFEDVQTQMMDFTTQTVKCHILRQQGLALQTNIVTQGGTEWGWLEEDTVSTVDLFALPNSTAWAAEWEQHYPALPGLAQLQMRGLDPALGPPNQGGCWSNPSAQEAGQEPSGNPFPPVFLQFKVLFGRNNSRPKSLD